MDLNKEQKEAVMHKDGPCMVLAPPGSGKTLIITQRIKYMIEEHKIDPCKILVITFTRNAAAEMKDRFLKLIGTGSSQVTFGTFHSFLYAVLRNEYGINSQNLISEDECYKLLKNVVDRQYIESSSFEEDDEDFISELLKEIGFVKNGLLSLKEFKSQQLNSEEFANVFHEFERRKKELKKFDFDDILVQCYALFRKKPEILERWRRRFQYILIDEFQDINKVQFEVVNMLAHPDNNLFVVGDDDQSIYGFRSATPKLMLNMHKDYPSLKIIHLTMNYRSTKYIVNHAARVILHNDQRYKKHVESFRGEGSEVQIKEVADELDEAKTLAIDIQEAIQKGSLPGEIAVLYRAGTQARMISEMFIEYQIPFEMRDYVPNLYDHFAVRDIMAYLQLASGKRDRNLFLMICNRPVRYISRSCFENRVSSFDEMRNFYLDKNWMQDKIDQFEFDVKMMERMTPYAAIKYIRKRIGYDEFLKEYADENHLERKKLMDVLDELEEHSKANSTFQEWKKHIDEYSAAVTEEERNRRGRKNRSFDKVQLMTMHSSKGLEFERVYIVHANEGEVPYKKALDQGNLEEERRLFYVAMTRAKDELCIYYLQQKNGSSIKPSRFVDEILGKKRRK